MLLRATKSLATFAPASESVENVVETVTVTIRLWGLLSITQRQDCRLSLIGTDEIVGLLFLLGLGLLGDFPTKINKVLCQQKTRHHRPLLLHSVAVSMKFDGKLDGTITLFSRERFEFQPAAEVSVVFLKVETNRIDFRVHSGDVGLRGSILEQRFLELSRDFETLRTLFSGNKNSLSLLLDRCLDDAKGLSGTAFSRSGSQERLECPVDFDSRNHGRTIQFSLGIEMIIVLFGRKMNSVVPEMIEINLGDSSIFVNESRQLVQLASVGILELVPRSSNDGFISLG